MNQVAATRRRPVDPYAIVTYALAVLWLFGIGSALALYAGRLSLRRMRANAELRGRTVAWAGIAVAILVGLPLAALWLALTLMA
jgi:hypothetical protein